MAELTFLTTKQLSEAYPAFPIGTLKQLANEGHPACIRKKMKPGAKRAKLIWVKEWFEVWILEGNDGVSNAIKEKTTEVQRFLNELTKNPAGRPRKLSVVGD